MKHEYDIKDQRINKKKLLIISVVLAVLAAISYIGGVFWMGNLFMIALLLNALYRLFIKQMISLFQDRAWPWTIALYERQLRFFLKGRNPWYLFFGIIALFIFTIMLVGAAKPKVLFFPNNDPRSIYVFVKMPEGTDQKVTDSVTKIVEGYTYRVLGKNNPVVESVVSNVGFGASDNFFDASVASNKGKVTINFIESKFRGNISTTTYMDSLRELVRQIPGAQVTVEKNQMGPPTGKPVNIEITGENLEQLIATADNFVNYLDSLRIPGIEKLKSDFVNNKPEIVIDIDRERANREGISVGQVGLELRTAIYGKEASKYKEDEDEYPIQIRYSEAQRNNINKIINAKITYMDMTTGSSARSHFIGGIGQIQDTYGGINRKGLKRMITVSSGSCRDIRPMKSWLPSTGLPKTIPCRKGWR